MSTAAKTDRYLELVSSQTNGGSGTYFANIRLQFCFRTDGKDGAEPDWRAAEQEHKGVEFACQIDDNAGDEGRHLSYAHKLGISLGSDYHPESVETVERAVKLVKRLTKSYEEVQGMMGYSRSFGQFVTYHLGRMNVQGMFERRQSPHSLNRYTLHATDMIAYVIDQRVNELANECRKRAGKLGEALALQAL